MRDIEFKEYKLSILSKTNGMNIHKIYSLLASMEMSVQEYSQTGEDRWLKIALMAKKEINKVIYSTQ